MRHKQVSAELQALTDADAFIKSQRYTKMEWGDALTEAWTIYRKARGKHSFTIFHNTYYSRPWKPPSNITLD
jgi:hypothetical protein